MLNMAANTCHHSFEGMLIGYGILVVILVIAVVLAKRWG